MLKTELFCLLPDYVSTPDGMAVDKDGNLILACPNFGDPQMPGCLLRIDRLRNIEKWCDVPVLKETGQARPMGIAFGPDWDIYICDNQCWSGKKEYKFKGRILRLRVKNGKVEKCTTVACGMEHPNGIRIRGNYIYVTQSMLEKVKDPSGKLVSCVYRFCLNDEKIHVTNTLVDQNIIWTTVTNNPDCRYGLDGIEMDAEGNLYAGNFGDGTLWRLEFDEKGDVAKSFIYAQDPDNLTSTDGMTMDADGNMYIADFCANALAKVYPGGRVERICQSPDSDGFNGELDQPGEPCYWNGMLVVSCFDLVTGPIMVNTAHEMPATLAMLKL